VRVSIVNAFLLASPLVEGMDDLNKSVASDYNSLAKLKVAELKRICVARGLSGKVRSEHRTRLRSLITNHFFPWTRARRRELKDAPAPAMRRPFTSITGAGEKG
jgi:hypothetical protein